MNELKRPELKEHSDTSKEGNVSRVWEYYDEYEMDSFLSQIADKLEEARRLRNLTWGGDHIRANEADAIEKEVIKALRGE